MNEYLPAPGDEVVLDFVGEYNPPQGDAVVLDFGVDGDPSTLIRILVNGPLGVPQAVAFKTLDRRAQIAVVGPLGAPQALAYSYLMRKADLSVTGPLGLPQATTRVYKDVLANALLVGPLGTPEFRLKGTNLVEILGITVEWNYSDWAFDISVDWRFAGTEDEFTGELTYTGAFVIGAVEIPFTTTETHYTFGGIPPEVAWDLDVRAGIDGPTRSVSGVTTREVPSQVLGIEYVSTVDSLTFTWDPSLRADSYRARLYRDGILLEEQNPVSVAATYLGLEDGSVYVFEVSGVNETGPGFAGTRTAITAYIPPTAATNLRQADQTYVAVKVEWDKPPEKVTFWESEVYIAEPYALVHRGILPPVPLEKFYGLPRAGTTYQWRIRAGNPGGLSAWAEIPISTPGILIDSRLAVLPASYQEDFLFPDTWDGGTDLIAEGVGENHIARGFAHFTVEQYDSRLVKKRVTARDEPPLAVRFAVSLGLFRTFSPIPVEPVESTMRFGVQLGAFYTGDRHEIRHEASTRFGVTLNEFKSTPPIYTRNSSTMRFGVQLGNFWTEEQ